MLWDLCLVDPTLTKPTCSEMACGGTCSCQQTRQYSYCTQRSPRSRMAMKKGKNLHGLSSMRGHLCPNPHQWALLFPGSSQGGQRVGEKKKETIQVSPSQHEIAKNKKRGQCFKCSGNHLNI